MNKIQRYFMDKKTRNNQKKLENQSQCYLNKKVIRERRNKQNEIENTTWEMIDSRSMF